MNIIPTYQCNLRCKFCFNKDKWNNKKILDLDYLEQELYKHELTDIVIIGGEPSILPEHYLKDLINICTARLGKKPLLYTNLINPFQFPDKVKLYVSYDPEDRKCQNIVLNNLINLDSDYEICMLQTKNLLNNKTAADIVNLAERLRHNIHLETVDMSQEHLPDPNKLADFSLELAYQNSTRVFSTCVDYIKFKSTKEPPSFEDFDNDISLMPNNEYQLSSSHGSYKYYAKTYEEAYKEYWKRHKKASVCQFCKYTGNCLDIYRTENTCDYDYQLMEALKKKRDEYLRIISV
jgi:organic radical activating enzyme